MGDVRPLPGLPAQDRPAFVLGDAEGGGVTAALAGEVDGDATTPGAGIAGEVGGVSDGTVSTGLNAKSGACVCVFVASEGTDRSVMEVAVPANGAKEKIFVEPQSLSHGASPNEERRCVCGMLRLERELLWQQSGIGPGGGSPLPGPSRWKAWVASQLVGDVELRGNQLRGSGALERDAGRRPWRKSGSVQA